MARQDCATFENGAGGCYKPSVNESETIAEAQPASLARSQSAADQLRAVGFTYLVAPHIGRS
jgi:hypothetical protein